FGSGCGRGRFSLVLGRLKVFVVNSFQPVVPVGPIVLCRLFTNRARVANRSPPPHSACSACQCHLLALHLRIRRVLLVSVIFWLSTPMSSGSRWRRVPNIFC
uniref:Uncharacterized protein n=1 Tax=Aegilops tauschii subsp. strangulata TaxID=200361 RepID=A0A453HSQ7_AEGTS